jgi:hypothetical protein
MLNPSLAGRFHSSWTVARTGHGRLIDDVGTSPEGARHTSPGQRPGLGIIPDQQSPVRARHRNQPQRNSYSKSFTQQEIG